MRAYDAEAGTYAVEYDDGVVGARELPRQLIPRAHEACDAVFERGDSVAHGAQRAQSLLAAPAALDNVVRAPATIDDVAHVTRHGDAVLEVLRHDQGRRAHRRLRRRGGSVRCVGVLRGLAGLSRPHLEAH